MKQPVVIVGMGELGGVFARAFLGKGYPVYPVTRSVDIYETARYTQKPTLVLIAVGEKDLPSVLESIPGQWHDKVALLQNELLPHHWQKFNFENITVMSIWFEKKKRQACKVLIPTRIHGPKANFIADCLEGIGISSKILASDDELLNALVIKNVFVLTINIAGLKVNGTVGALWSEHNELARQIAGEVIDVQEWLTDTTFSREQLLNGVIEGINGDPNHKCKGRSAAGRLSRVIELADEAGLAIPGIRGIQAALA